jgi:hypothetical protein
MIFLSSLPRSGSTLLTSLLNQRPDVYASPTSNLCDTMGAAAKMWEQNPITKASGGKEDDIIRILQGIQSNRYDTDKLVFDKGRGWPPPQIMKTMMKVQGDVKIVATVRPLVECLASFAKLMKPDNIAEFCKRGELAQHLFNSYAALQAGYKEYPDNFLFIEYDDLVGNPQVQLNRIADFVGIDPFIYDFNNIEDSKEVDEVWGIENLHKVRRKIRKRRYSTKHILGQTLWNFYQGGEFWNDKPEPKKEKMPITYQHDALMAGDFKKSKRLAYLNLSHYPDDSDICFNAGWAKLSDDEVQDGYFLLDKGRETLVWGDPHCGSNKPLWDGEENVTVLLRLERGLGDQVHQVRYARDLKKLGCTVIVSCQPSLAEILRHAEGVDVVIQHDAACGVLHDFYLPAMSAPIQFNYQSSADIDGSPYIPASADVVPHRVGLRWSGLPAYEHQTKRLFPHELLFNTMKDRAYCINLQKDEGEEYCPDWVEKVDLSTWTATAAAISSCEMVVTSCTCIAHLAGAMGVPTMIIVPVVPYYLWTLPGTSTPYYDSVKLLRQTDPDDWLAPFKQLAEMVVLREAA